MNLVIFKGNTSQDVSMRYSGELAIANTSIAINSGYGDKKRVDYFDLVAFGKTAEVFEKYVTKGTAICVRCHAQLNKWKDKDGNNRYNINFVVDEMEFCGGKNANTESKPQPTPQAGDDGFMQIPDGVEDELPFR